MKNISRYILAMAAWGCAAGATAEIPAGYYSSLDGKAEGELKTAIFNRIHDFRTVSSYSNLPQYFRVTDVYPESSRWWDMYSDIPLYAPSFSGLNREHSFPKSWWKQNGSVDYTSAYVDLYHLYPSEAKANMAKSNYPLGEVDMSAPVQFDNGMTRVGYPVQGQGGGSTKVFEPDDEYKGDFARTYFYMATCYQNLTWAVNYMVSNNVYPTLNAWSVRLLMDWHHADPVSQKELDRNEAVYSFQGNRNPFIDYPELADYLWGDLAGQAFHPGTSPEPVGDAELMSPDNGSVLEFGQVAEGSTATARLFFQGNNVRKALTVTVYRGDKSMFSLPVTTVSAADVNSEAGKWLTVTYRPTELGSHTARLLISGTGPDGNGTRGVELRGECLPVPVLTAPTALPASNITTDSYMANWSIPEGEVADYFIVTRTRYNAGLPTVETVLAEASGELMEEFDLSDSESYSVRSVRLGVESPESNVVFVDHSGITDAVAPAPVEVLTEAGLIAVRCPMAGTTVRVFDVAGREVARADNAPAGITEFFVPAGVYIVSAEGSAPVKVTVR